MPKWLLSTRRVLALVLASVVPAVVAGVPPVPPAQPSAAAASAPGAGGYSQPPQAILDVMRAPVPAMPVPSPSSDRILLVSRQEFPDMSRVAAPFLRLAGVRIEPRNRSRHDTPGGYGIAECIQAMELVSVSDGARRPVALPAGVCADRPVWSADGRRFAFANTTPDAVELWIGDARAGTVRPVRGVRLNPMLGQPLQWMPDQQSLLVKRVPARQGPPPPAPVVPPGPSIQQTEGGQGQSSTYEARDTLGSRHDEDLFDHYAAAQLAIVDAASGAVKPLGGPANYEALAPAPDGRHLLVTWIRRPYSYVTTHQRFPREVEIWDCSRRAEPVVSHVVSLPLADRVPVHGVPTGPRDFEWRPTEPATLVWAEALDGGDWNVDVSPRDKVMMRKAPFGAPALEIARTAQRFGGIDWGERPDTALLTEYDSNRSWWRTSLVNVDDPRTAPRLLWDLSMDEHYAHPGSPVSRTLPNGAQVLRQEGDAIFLAGSGGTPEGDRPFLDRFDLVSGKTQRLFRSDRDAWERFMAFTGPGSATFLTTRQSPTEPPDIHVRMLGAPAAAAEGEAVLASTSRALTHTPDPAPAVRAIRKRLVKYRREDGLELSFTLYTPPGYQEGTRVPTILYAYPLDYADASKAGQVTGSQQRFIRLRQYQLLLLAGYAIIDNASFPIVGDPKRAYDHYLEQLVADAKAAVGEAVRLGVADPERVGVTGHSHGALMTVNLLAHSNLFRAGVATSGSYNKTLTPFGFQNERRSVWDATDVYLKTSPFFYADKLKTPLLIVHGTDDANPGTTPLQASKLYEAVRGNGGTARLVLLPHEPHWYAARESNEQLVYEMLRWFDTYVKDAKPRPTR